MDSRKYLALLDPSRCSDISLQDLFIKLAEHGYDLNIHNDFDVDKAEIKVCVVLKFRGEYAYRISTPDEIFENFKDLLTHLLLAVNTQCNARGLEYNKKYEF